MPVMESYNHFLWLNSLSNCNCKIIASCNTVVVFLLMQLCVFPAIEMNQTITANCSRTLSAVPFCKKKKKHLSSNVLQHKPSVKGRFHFICPLSSSDKSKPRPWCISSQSIHAVLPGCHILFADDKAGVPQLLLTCGLGSACVYSRPWR